MYSPRRWVVHAAKNRPSQGPRWLSLSRNIRKSSQFTKSFRRIGRKVSRVQRNTTPARSPGRFRADRISLPDRLADLDSKFVDAIGEAGGSEPVVDVDDRDTRHACSQHREERGEASLRNTVADAG